MAEPEQGDAAAYFRDAPLDVILDIVRRLPAVSVIRLRAVYKAWRDVTSDAGFVNALRHLQTSQPLLCFDLEAWPDSYVDLRDYCVEAVNLRSDELRSIFRFTDNTYCYYDRFVDSYDGEEVGPAEFFKPLLVVHASLDGFLLVSINNWYVCNPATHQWAALPPEFDYHYVVGLYHHVSSDEYRVLYHTKQGDEEAPTCYYVLTVGSQVARSIGCPFSPVAATDLGLVVGLYLSSHTPPIQLHGKLHWPPLERQSMNLVNLLVFDTKTEVFSWMASSPMTLRERSATTGQLMILLEMEGKLGVFISRINGEELELWHLQHYEDLDWVMLHLIKLPVLQMTSLHHEDYWFPSVVSPEGDVMIVCRGGFTHCNRHGKELQSLWFPEKTIYKLC
jgi:F-box interacting protein